MPVTDFDFFQGLRHGFDAKNEALREKLHTSQEQWECKRIISEKTQDDVDSERQTMVLQSEMLFSSRDRYSVHTLPGLCMIWNGIGIKAEALAHIPGKPRMPMTDV
jgi:hypothetical protein